MDFIEHAKKCIERADNNESKLTQEILDYNGMSGSKGRHLLNNLCNMEECRYLEIGMFQGSTFFSAIYNNSINAVGIDNWSEFQHYKDSKQLLYTNLEKYRGDNNVTIIDDNCWKSANREELHDINVYFYDGGHSEQDQYKAIKDFYPKLADTSIILIDDYTQIKGRTAVVKGTNRALQELPVDVLYSVILGPEIWENKSADYVKSNEWWRSMRLMVLKKRN